MSLKVDFLIAAVLVFLLSGVSGLRPKQDMVHRFRSDYVNEVQTFERGLDESPDADIFRIFCRDGDPKLLQYFFRSATLKIISSADDIKLIKGTTDLDVYTKYLTSSRWYFWAANLLPWRIREANFPTFNSSCVGIASKSTFSAVLITRPIDPWNFVIFVAGVSLFFFSPNLAKSSLFFYSSGTLIGALAAALILVFIFSRWLPRGKLTYVTFSVIWSMCLYFASESYNRWEELFHEKLPYILVYLTTGAVIAFITCYRMGPPSHPRTLDIIRWILQAMGLCLIHLSSELKEVSTAIIVSILFVYNFAGRFILFGKQLWRRAFPAKVKLLTEEEYIAQGTRETAKNLEQLREYCSSPECNSWKLVSRIKDPRRFASFMDGSSHLSDDELMAYETQFIPETGDSSSEEEPEGEDDSQEVRVLSYSRNGRGPIYGGPPSGGTSTTQTRNTRMSTRNRPSTSNNTNSNAPTQYEYLTDDEDSFNNPNTLPTDDED